MKSPKTAGLAVAVMSGAAPAGTTANVVDAGVSLVKPLRSTEQFWKRYHAVRPSLSETPHSRGIPSLRRFHRSDTRWKKELP
jgi:hypothetical protein